MNAWYINRVGKKCNSPCGSVQFQCNARVLLTTSTMKTRSRVHWTLQSHTHWKLDKNTRHGARCGVDAYAGNVRLLLFLLWAVFSQPFVVLVDCSLVPDAGRSIWFDAFTWRFLESIQNAHFEKVDNFWLTPMEVQLRQTVWSVFGFDLKFKNPEDLWCGFCFSHNTHCPSETDD